MMVNSGINLILLLIIPNQLTSLQCHVNLASEYTLHMINYKLLTCTCYYSFRSCTQTVSLKNPLDMSVRFKVKNTNTKHFIVTGLAEGQVRTLHVHLCKP